MQGIVSCIGWNSGLRDFLMYLQLSAEWWSSLLSLCGLREAFWLLETGKNSFPKCLFAGRGVHACTDTHACTHAGSHLLSNDGNEHEETFVKILLMNICRSWKVKASNLAVLVMQPRRQAEDDATKELVIFIGLDFWAFKHTSALC